ncbi:MAG: type 1 glutamine amidotransferase [Bacteroidales bacterium]
MKESFRIHCFMHVPFEGPGVIADWAAKKGYPMEYTRFYDGDPLPDVKKVELLILMGGPMDVIDEQVNPWMAGEIDWIREYLEKGQPVLGICLGAQLIARALGADVYPGREKEIGWHNLQFLSALGSFRIWEELPNVHKVFHWHGDTFSIPERATLIASSRAFPNQGFIYRNKVIALQFHLEVTPAGVSELLENSRHELTEGPYVQNEKEILNEKGCYSANHELMFRLLDYLSGQDSQNKP